MKNCKTTHIKSGYFTTLRLRKATISYSRGYRKLIDSKSDFPNLVSFAAAMQIMKCFQGTQIGYSLSLILKEGNC